MAVSIKDIAKKANVTPMTVSLSLRDLAGVSDEKRREIKRLAEQMGYQPNYLGRGLQGGRTHSLGLLWSLCGPQVATELSREVTLRAQKHGYISYVVDSLGDPGVIDRTLKDYSHRRVDAVAVQYIAPEFLTEKVISQLSSFPASAVVSTFACSLPVDHIHHNLLAGIRHAAMLFISQNRSRPAALYTFQGNRHKAEAFIGEFRNHGIEVSPDSLMDLSTFDVRKALNFLDARFPDGRFPYDCVFCQIDDIAMILMKWLRKKNIKVPDDVPVIGFNNSIGCDCFDPALASVSFNDSALAEEIDKMIFSRLENPELPPREVSVPSVFIYRESAG